MLYIYTLVITLYYWVIRIAALFGYDQARRWYSGRQSAPTPEMPNEWKDKNRIWIHSASYGEYEMAKPIVARLLEDPRNRLYLSFFSPSGYENLHFDDPRICKLYLPIDLKSQMSKCLEKLAPKKVLFIKYEFWFNLLNLLRTKGIPYYFTSIHINRDSYMLKIPALKNLLRSAAGLYCHNAISMKILKEKGFDNLSLFGDTRINKALQNMENHRTHLRWTQSSKTISYGSLLPSEISMMVTMVEAFPECNHLIAPHDIDSESIRRVTTQLDTKYSLFSEVGKDIIQSNVLIVNTLGDLKYLYADCAAAYVGGGFNKGPHSIIEPLAYGVPTVIGPHIAHYPMARQLKEETYLEVIDRPDQLEERIRKILSTPTKTPQQIKKKISGMAITLDLLIQELSA